jgi:DHA1 family bicyclomycin/chloramphenicol resistance-like MFS transporter
MKQDFASLTILKQGNGKPMAETLTSHHGDIEDDRPEILRSAGMSFTEFVAIVAMILALNALAIDIMLPALSQISKALNILQENDRQTIILFYLLGFGGGQLLFGPVADALGRRKVIIGGLLLYGLASFGSVLSQDLQQLLIARTLQGVGCAAARVAALSVVRDCYSGRKMGKAMSLVMAVFMTIPIVAPSLGQAILLTADWRWIFVLLLVSGIAMTLWTIARLPETLPTHERMPLNITDTLSAYRRSLTNRFCLGYTLAMTFILGALFAYISMCQQLFVDVFELGALFPLFFAGTALSMAGSSVLNAHMVEVVGMRRLSHAACIIFTLFGVAVIPLAGLGLENLWLFLGIVMVALTTLGFLISNFNSMALEPLGDVAGTASSVIGTISTLGGATLGFVMGQLFDGTTVPLGLAFALYGGCAILCVLFAERGLLFHALEDTH